MGKVYHVNVNQNEVVVAILISGKVYFKQRLFPGIQNGIFYDEGVSPSRGHKNPKYYVPNNKPLKCMN